MIAEVASLKGHGNTLPITHEEAEFVASMQQILAQAQEQLGRERAAFVHAEQLYKETEHTLMQEIDRARAQYTAFVDILAKKHVNKPGRFEFRPDLQAFVQLDPDLKEEK